MLRILSKAINEEPLSREDKEIIKSIKRKENYASEIIARKGDKIAQLNYQVNTLQKKVTSLSEDLDRNEIVNNNGILEIKELRDEIVIRDDEIKKLKEEMKSKFNLNDHNNERPGESSEQEVKEINAITDKKVDQISKLTEKLENYQTDARQFEKKIETINVKLQAVAKCNPNDYHISTENKQMSILHLNITFIEENIEYLQQKLLSELNMISQLQTEQRLVAQILGFDKIEKNLYHTAKTFLDNFENQAEEKKKEIDNLKKELGEAKMKKKKLQKEVKTLKVNEIQIRKNYESMKKAHHDLQRQINERRPSSARYGDSGNGNSITLPDISDREYQAKSYTLSRSNKSVLDGQYLQQIAEKVGPDKCHALGNQLSISKTTIETIILSNQHNAGVWVLNVLTTWNQRLSKDQNGKHILARALKAIGLVALGEAVEDYKVNGNGDDDDDDDAL
ncbi:unnamed protein product [Owenia fusiformis]|uniref:Death domain-containing protein n=1 Tax=Owenia fusiformis TaxID=6347 RepID=A0A8S4PHS5_OWEFU|nr:unnamed protein product [Owenia fusiformis]